MAGPDEVLARQIEKVTLTMRANVYARIPTGQPGAGTYSPTPVKTLLKCHLSQAAMQAATTTAQRAELATGGDLLWERGYDLPNGAQLSVDAYPGWRFNVRDNTQWTNTGPAGGEVSRGCVVTRIQA